MKTFLPERLQGRNIFIIKRKFVLVRNMAWYTGKRKTSRMHLQCDVIPRYKVADHKQCRIQN